MILGWALIYSQTLVNLFHVFESHKMGSKASKSHVAVLPGLTPL